MKNTAPYGSWKSIVTAEFVSGKERNLTDSVQVVGTDIWFLENRPDEGGRAVLMKMEHGSPPREILPVDFNVRTRYLEYGGSSFIADQKSCFFVNFKDQQIYIAEPGILPRKLTSENDSRFSDLIIDRKRNRLIALREVCTRPESKNTICTIDLTSGNVVDWIAGHDFFMGPRLNATGDKLLWISWDHPNMAWNGTELWTAQVEENGSLSAIQKVAGDRDHGVCQAIWGLKDEVFFVAELEEWFHLYRAHRGEISNLHPIPAEFAPPNWTPGQSYTTVSPDGSLYGAFLKQGRWQLIRWSESRGVEQMGTPCSLLAALQAREDSVVAVVGHSSRPVSLVEFNRQGERKELYAPSQAGLPEDEISMAEEIQFPTEDGSTGFAWFYAPKNASFQGPASENPPLVVRCHGGPTSMSHANFKKDIQFWTNRGYAVVDVNYGGSTGYGRRYRERLRLNWGLVDVSDCVAVVQQLAKENKIDPRRVAIRGGSAGGYTTLAALAFTQNIFTVGASYYGVSELELLAQETHKLESRYLDQLIGPYPEAMAHYKRRSPIEHIQRLNCPIVFFQGDEDKVVPPNQSELMFQSLKSKGIPTEYHLYAGEGHGFRRSENLQHSLKAEHFFFSRFFGFEVQAEDRP